MTIENVIIRMCSGFDQYICTLPWALCALGIVRISVKPLAAVLQPINVLGW